MMDGTWVENPDLIKAEVLQHFQNRFNEPHLNRPNLDGVQFNVLSPTQREMRIVKNCVFTLRNIFIICKYRLASLSH